MPTFAGSIAGVVIGTNGRYDRLMPLGERRTAICRCGRCTVEVVGEPVFNLICHCSSCRRRTGGPCGWTAVFREDQLLGRRGEFQIYQSDGDVGRAANSFCANCGTTLFFVPASMPGMIGCAGGCFVDVPLGEPTVSASDDRRCSWLRLPESWTVRRSSKAGADKPGSPGAA